MLDWAYQKELDKVGKKVDKKRVGNDSSNGKCLLQPSK